MARITAGRNVSSFKYESGTYGVVSGGAQWIGLVQNFAPADSENIQRVRYHGTNTRNVDLSLRGVRDYGGTFEYFPQDMKMALFALGSGYDGTAAGGVVTHQIDELESNEVNQMTSGTDNPFASFGFESTQRYTSGQSLVRTYKGCVVDTFSLAKSDNSLPLSATVDFIAQSLDFGSIEPTFGNPTASTARPLAPFESQVHFPSGTALKAKTWDFAINNNFDRAGAHVCNGSREMSQPTPTDRAYELNITMDAESTEAARLYGIWKSGGDISSNAGIAVTRWGGTSGTHWFVFSGCDIDTFDAPNPVEGINEWSLGLIPKSCSVKAQDTTAKYLAW